MIKFFIFLILCLFHLNTNASKLESDSQLDLFRTEGFWISAKVQKGSVRPGQTLSLLLQKSGFHKKDLADALAKKSQVIPRKYQLRVGDIYLTIKDKNQFGLMLYDHYIRTTYFFWKSENEVLASRFTPTYRKVVFNVDGRVVGSLLASIQRKVKDKQIAYRFLDAYRLSLTPLAKSSSRNFLKKLRRGDAFSLSYEKLFLGNTFIRNGEVVKTSLELQGQTYGRNFIAFNDGGVFVSNNPTEHNLDTQSIFYAPVSYLKISSPFNRRRFHPIKKVRTPHLGVDFELPPGQSIFASRSGTVTKVGRSRAGGYYVRLKHSNNYESFYNHMSFINKDLHRGQYIKAGYNLGGIGCTGYCTKPHLHFGIKKNGHFINPKKVLKPYPFHYKSKVEEKLAFKTADSRD